MNETWKPIPSLDGWYDASSGGRVRSWKVGGRSQARRETPLIMKVHSDPTNRYWFVTVRPRGAAKLRNRVVHQLVAEAFFGPATGRIVRHKNNDGQDNRLENLAYGTNSENQMDRVTHKTSNRGRANGQAKLSEDQVRSVFAMRKEGMSMERIGSNLGVSRRTVGCILSGDRWGWMTEDLR